MSRPDEMNEEILEGIRIMGRRDGRYDLDNAADTGLVSHPAAVKAYNEAYAEGQAERVDTTRDDEP